MANASGMGPKRDEGFIVRFNKAEKKSFKEKAGSAKLSLQDYALCKILDIPFNLMGGKNPRGRPKTEVAAKQPETSAQ